MVATDTPGTFLALADNGYGTKANSADFLLCVYRVRPDFRTATGGSGTVKVDLAFRLSDPDRKAGFPLVADAATYPNSAIPVLPEIREKRLLTGGDFDPESLVRLGDGTFWVGDEYGPFLLHFSAEGKLLEPPVDLTNLPGRSYQSPDHPRPKPGMMSIPRSGGFEALELLDWGGQIALRGLLEKSGMSFTFFPEMKSDEIWKDADSRFPLAFNPIYPLGAGHSIGEAAHVGPGTLVVERNGGQGDAARFKTLQMWTVKEKPPTPEAVGGVLNEKRLVANLLDLSDPNDLNRDGRKTFRFPFVTIESVLVIDPQTLLVANDNNYPFSAGRAAGKPDPTEFILIKLDRPLVGN